ncbi:MAG TPA: LysR family transcriptional regulator, partial [Helicobacteraceae bacterium]|nr:LysR family transcriptional regulator [Helicobacteraceae bacterium]
MFTLRQLQIFESLSQCEKVIDVANALDISQSAVSMSIKELERILDEPLFERIGKKLTLNERGILFLQQISRPMQELENIYKDFATDKLQGELRIGASVTIADYLMPKLLAGYRIKNEKVELRLRSANTEGIVAMVKEGICDI